MKEMRQHKSAARFAATLFFTAMMAAPVAATDVFLSDDQIEHYAEGENEIVAMGGDVELTGDAEGDVVALGGNVHIDMSIGGDLAAFGGNVSILGAISGEAAVFGGDVSLDGAFSQDVAAFGGNIDVEATSAVAGDMTVFAGDANIDGAFTGEFEAGANNLALLGQFADDVEVAANHVDLEGYFSGDVVVKAIEVTFGDNVQFLGDLEIYSPNEVELPEGIIIGGDFSYEYMDADDISEFTPEELWALIGVGIVILIIGMLFVFGIGVLVVAVAGDTSRRGVIMMRDNTGKAFLYGIAVIFLGLVGAIIATSLYEPLGLLFLLYWLALMIGYVFAGYAIFTLLIDKGRKPHGGGRRFGYALLGLLVMIIIMMIPILNIFAFLAALMVGTGAFFGGLVGRDSDENLSSGDVAEA